MEQKTEASQAVDDLLPCPFCGAAARIESNRDWHKLRADHDESCVFDPDDYDLMYPASPGYLLEIAQVWNRRAALKAQPAPTEAAQGEDSARLSIPVSAYLWLMGAGGDAFAQPLRPGAFWWRDTFNQLAGVDMMEIIKQDRARASAETGGV